MEKKIFLCFKIIKFSGNYTLYADISTRVMNNLARLTPKRRCIQSMSISSVSQVMDKLNKHYGRGTLRVAAEGYQNRTPHDGPLVEC